MSFFDSVLFIKIQNCLLVGNFKNSAKPSKSGKWYYFKIASTLVHIELKSHIQTNLCHTGGM
jgi:hypothetical protein